MSSEATNSSKKRGEDVSMETEVKKNEEGKLETTADVQSLLEKIEKNVAKQTKYSRLQFFCAALAVVILVVALLAVGIKLFPLIDQVSQTLSLVNTTITDMKLGEMTKSVTDLAQAGSKGISDALKQIESALGGVESAIKVIEGLDIEGLNGGIEKLNSVLEPMARFFGRK